MATRGIHLIWTCYGTWLPGDARGHWSPLFDLYGRVVRGGGKLQLPDETTRRASSMLLRERPFRLDETDAATIANELSAHVRDGRTGCTKPVAIAAAVEPIHVHLLIGPLAEDIKLFGGRVKGRTASEVLASGRHGDRTHVWTAKFWKVFLFDELGVRTVRAYIEDHNLRAGRPANPFLWCHPDYV